jgi:enoyl-CoA hydratase/carnithine racemase
MSERDEDRPQREPGPEMGPETGLETGLETALLRGGVRLRHDGPVATVTLDRPESRNSQTPATWEALRMVGQSLQPGTRVVVVTGAGGTFSSGLDRRLLDAAGPLSGELAGSDAEVADTIGAWQEAFTWLRRPDLVSVAAVRGAAVGAGFQLALACDLRVLSDDARLAMREPALGLVPDLTGTKPLVELVGYSRALEICATTRWVHADEAREIGLATAVVPSELLEDTVADLVAALTEPPHDAVTATKALLQSAGSLGLDAQRRAEREAQVRRLREPVARSGE